MVLLSLLYTDLPKVGPQWCHAGFHNKLIGSFAFVGCKSSLSHFALSIPSLPLSSVALWCPKVQLRHTESALLPRRKGNACPLLCFCGRHAIGETLSLRTANFNTRGTLNELPLKGCSEARHCSPLLTFLGIRKDVYSYVFSTDWTSAWKEDGKERGQDEEKWVGALQQSLHLFQKWEVIRLWCPTPKTYSLRRKFDQIFHDLRVSVRQTASSSHKYTAALLHCSESDLCQWMSRC